jgi:hypothetical protein
VADFTKTPEERAMRRNELVDRMAVLLCVLLDVIADDAGDNPATVVLTEVLQEAACELQEIRDMEAHDAKA